LGIVITKITAPGKNVLASIKHRNWSILQEIKYVFYFFGFPHQKLKKKENIIFFYFFFFIYLFFFITFTTYKSFYFQYDWIFILLFFCIFFFCYRCVDFYLSLVLFFFSVKALIIIWFWFRNTKNKSKQVKLYHYEAVLLKCFLLFTNYSLIFSFFVYPFYSIKTPSATVLFIYFFILYFWRFCFFA